MFEGMKVISKGDLAVGFATAAILGGAIATTVIEQLERLAAQRAPAKARVESVRAPVVAKKTAFETEVLIQLQVDGKDVTCRLWMDHRSKGWSLSC